MVFSTYVPHRGAEPEPGHCQRQTGSSWPAADRVESGVVVNWLTPANTRYGDMGKDNPPGILQDMPSCGGVEKIIRSSVIIPVISLFLIRKVKRATPIPQVVGRVQWVQKCATFVKCKVHRQARQPMLIIPQSQSPKVVVKVSALHTG